MNKRIPKKVQRWVDSIKLRNPELQTNFYSKKCVLLATFETMLIGKEQILGYMKTFLNTKIANGLYEFVYMENGEVQKVVARYTFVINKGKIITHHSSVNPE